MNDTTTGTADKPVSIAPLPLPAGSFDLSKLLELGETLAATPEGERDELAIAKVGELREGTFTRADDDAGAQEGFVLRRVVKTIDPGTEVDDGKGGTRVEGAVEITEEVRVFDRQEAEKPPEEQGFDAAAFVARTLDEITDDELKALPADQLAQVREAEVGARNRTTLLSRIDAVAAEETGA